MGPDPKIQEARLAQQTLKVEIARREKENALKFIEEQCNAARRADLGDHPTQSQLNAWEQTKGKPFAARREKAIATYRAAVERIRKETPLPLSKTQQELQNRRRRLEQQHFEAMAEVQRIEKQLQAKLDGIHVRALTDEYRVRPGETAKLVFFVDGGKPPYEIDGQPIFYQFNTTKERILKKIRSSTDQTRKTRTIRSGTQRTRTDPRYAFF